MMPFIVRQPVGGHPVFGRHGRDQINFSRSGAHQKPPSHVQPVRLAKPGVPCDCHWQFNLSSLRIAGLRLIHQDREPPPENRTSARRCSGQGPPVLHKPVEGSNPDAQRLVLLQDDNAAMMAAGSRGACWTACQACSAA